MKEIPNNHTREEFTIVLEYLIKMTSKEHYSNQKEIMQYALNKYGVEIRRQRVSTILDSIYNLSLNNYEIFKIKVVRVSTGTRCKYYVSQRVFSTDEIVSIVSAIKNDRYSDKESSENLIEEFLNVTTDKSQREEILKRINVRTIVSNKKSTRLNFRIKELEKAIENKSCLTITVNNREVKGYVYKLFEKNNEVYFVLGNIETKKLEAYEINNVTITDKVDMFDDAPKIEDIVDLNDFRDVDSFIERNYKAEDEHEVEASFYFHKDDELLSKIKSSFENTFKEEMNYSLSKRQYKFPVSNRCVPLVADVIEVSYKGNVEEFLKWAVSYEIAPIIKVTGSNLVLNKLTKYHEDMLKRLSSI